MQFHTGRLFDHVHLVVRDLDAAKAFYRAVLTAVHPEIAVREGEDFFNADELWIAPGEALSHVHIAFQAPDREAVERFYEAGLKAGGHDHGAPGLRQYHPGYYAAFLYDPDGNNVEAVFHGPAERSAASVVITAQDPPSA